MFDARTTGRAGLPTVEWQKSGEKSGEDGDEGGSGEKTKRKMKRKRKRREDFVRLNDQ